MYEGWTVPIDYDPLLAKLIGYGRPDAGGVTRLLRALYEYFVGGIKTNISLFRRILADEDFRSGKIDTGFLERLPGAGSEKSGLENRHGKCCCHRSGGVCGAGRELKGC